VLPVALVVACLLALSFAQEDASGQLLFRRNETGNGTECVLCVPGSWSDPDVCSVDDSDPTCEAGACPEDSLCSICEPGTFSNTTVQKRKEVVKVLTKKGTPGRHNVCVVPSGI